MKKFLSIFLVVLMFVGMLPMTAIHTHAATAGDTVTYTFSSYAAGTSGKTDESHVLDETVTLISNKAFFTTQLRLYNSNDTQYKECYAIVNSVRPITALGVKAGYKAATLTVSGSNDGGSTWKTIGTISVASSYADKSLNFSDSSYTSLKLVATGGQVRIQTMTLTFGAASAACQHTNTTTTTVDATCTEDGSKIVTCNDCGEEVSKTTIPALGHDYQLSGTTYTCSGCGDSYEIFNISFSVPEGVDPIADMEYSNGGITLPTPTGTPSGDYEYTFAGWTTGEVDDTTEKPTYYKAGEKFTADKAVTLYALYTYTVAGEGGSGETTWDLVTNAGDLANGDRIVIVASGYNYALSTKQNNNNRGQASVTKSGNAVTFGTDVQVLELKEGNASGTFGLYTGSGYLYAASSGDNYLRTETTLSNNSSWKIEITSDGVATIKAQGTNTRNWLRYNTSSKIFSCYSSGQAAISIYKENAGSSDTTYYTTEITVSECTHEWDQGTQTTAPTCENKGVMTYTCTLCDETKTEEIAALGHTEGNPVKENNKDATCTEDGSYDTVVYCSVCNKELSRVTTTVEATGHSFGSDGVCTVCGEAASTTAGARYYIAAIRTSGNYFYMTSDLGTGTKRYQAVDSGLTTLPESITEPETGYVFVLIKNSDDTYSIQAEGVDGDNYLGHTSGNSGTLVAEASALKLKMTDNKDGTYSFSYVASDATRYLALNETSGNNYFAWYKSGQKQNLVLIPVEDPCDHAYGEGVVTAPTCTTAGYTTYTCSLCGKAKTENEVPATGHSYGNGVQTTAPGCTTTGVMTYTCSACGDIKTEEIPAAGHKMDEGVVVDATCETDGSKTYTCSVCGEKQVETINKLGHSWDEGQITTAATCETAGVKTFTCQNDTTHTKTEEISAIGHSWDAGVDVTEATCDAPGSKLYTCQNDSSHTKTEATPPKGHQFSNGVCSVCNKEVSRFQLVTDYTEILAGGEYIVAAKVGDNFYAIDSDYSAYPIAVTGAGTEMIVIYADGLPYWNVQYYLGRNNCISLRNTAGQYLAGTDGTGLALKDSAWAWTFIDGSNANGQQSDGTFAVTQTDGSVAYVLASATILDRAISLKNTEGFMNYSVRTANYNRELYFFKMVRANVSEYTVNFIENGTTTMTMTVPANDNGLKMPQPAGNTMPEGYTKFVGWVEVPHTESMVAPANIFSAEEGDGFNNTTVITEDKTFYALYSREDADGEGQTMDYHLVTDNNQLVAGQKYIIVGINKNGNYYAMSNQLSGDRNGTLVTPDANGVITFTPGDNVSVLELTQGSYLNTYAFLDLGMNQFLYCASTGTENALKSQAALNEKASFVITINADGSYSVITSQTSSSTRANLMFNTIDTNSKIFSCYDLAVTSVDETKTFLYVGVPNSTFATYYTTGLCAHEWFVKDSQIAGCTQPGYTMYACSICGEIKMEDVLAHGHDVGESVVTTEPTCTTTGEAISTCKNCGDEFKEIIPALGHTAVVDAAVAPKCTETGLTEGKHCSVCDTVLVPQQEIAANGHSYVTDIATINNVPTITHNCSACDDADHKSELKFVTASLTLQNNIVVNFKTTDNVFGNGVMEGFTDLRAEFTYGNRVGENMIVATSADIVKQTDGKYVVPCRQVTPSQIGDKITATLYGTYDGVEYSYEMKYSAAEYCYSTMVREDATDELKTLLVNLLYYCDAARAYTTYQGVDEEYEYYGSVTEKLTDEQKTYHKVSDPDEFKSVMGLTGEGTFTATWKSAALVLGESSAIQFRADLGGNENVSAQVFVAGREYGRVQMEKITEGEYAGQYLIRVEGLAAHQMRDTVEVTLYSGETAISKTVSYSMESYVYSKLNDGNENLVGILKAMMSYGDAAVAYKASV